jgi:hypothetical protein
MPRLTRKEVLRRFRHHKPKNADEALRNCLVPLTYLSEGAYRRTYQIGNLPLVIKFPYCSDWYEDKPIEERNYALSNGIKHSNTEMRSLRRILRSKGKYVKLHRYMPKVYHFNPATGAVLMHKYRNPNRTTRKFNRMLERIDAEAQAVMKKWVDVDNPGNIGYDEKGRVVILDLGCFEDESC